MIMVTVRSYDELDNMLAVDDICEHLNIYLIMVDMPEEDIDRQFWVRKIRNEPGLRSVAIIFSKHHEEGVFVSHNMEMEADL